MTTLQFSKDAIGLAVLVLVFAFMSEMLLEIPGMLRRGFVGVTFLLVSAVAAPLIADQFGAPLWLLYTSAGVLGLLAWLLRIAFRCPRCKKPLHTGIHHSSNPLGGSGGRADAYYWCPWCGYEALGSQFRGDPLIAMREEEKRFDLLGEWKNKCPWVTLILEPLGLSLEFFRWWEVVHGEEPVPSDVAGQAEVLNEFLTLKGYPPINDKDAWAEVWKKRGDR
jgi:hypothetical protein